MFCSNCGANLRDGVRFCKVCGAAVEESPAQAPEMPIYRPAVSSYQPQPQIYQPPAYRASVYPAPEIEEPVRPAKLVFSILSIIAGILAFILCIVLAEDYYPGDSFLPLFLISSMGIAFGAVGMSGGKKPLCIVGIVFGALAAFINFIMVSAY